VPSKTVTEVFEAYPHAWIDLDTFAMFEGFLDHKLLVNRCKDCQRYFQPPWPMCPNCWSDAVAPTEVSGNGVIHTFVILHTGGSRGVDYAAGHPLLIVQLEEQDDLRVTGTMANCPNEDIRIGMPVRLTWVDRGGSPVPAFEPA
jgi:uncharacterized OB-fold protein